MAVHLDIRPRLTLPAEPRAAARRGWRMPPLALPAVGYWLAMAALTYGFTQLGPHPLDAAQAATTERANQLVAPVPALDPTTEPETFTNEPPLTTAPPIASEPPTSTEPAAAAEAPQVVARGAEPARESARAARHDDPTGPGTRDEQLAKREAPSREEPPRVALSFPEFTDSTRPAVRERAADGPRIDSLFDKADDRPAKDAAPAPAPPESAPEAPVATSSCEAAIARNNEQLTIGGSRGPADITREAYAGILQNGRYLSACTIPERTVFEICAAVRDGRAVGITIVSNPPNPQLNACVRGAVARLKFPRNPRLDVTHTRFDALRR